MASRIFSCIAFHYGLLCALLAHPIVMLGYLFAGFDVFEVWPIARAAWPVVLRRLHDETGWGARNERGET